MIDPESPVLDTSLSFFEATVTKQYAVAGVSCGAFLMKATMSLTLVPTQYPIDLLGGLKHISSFAKGAARVGRK